MKINIFCSSPNLRGIHQYSLYLARLTSKSFQSCYITPDICIVKRNSFLRFLYQISWELSADRSRPRADLEIFTSPRLPFWAHLDTRSKTLRGVVIHDFIQHIDSFSCNRIFSLVARFGYLELLKRVVHTIYSNASMKSADFYIFNSRVTAVSCINKFPRLASKIDESSLVLHPAPTFSRKSVMRSLRSVFHEQRTHIVRIHVVTGALQSKQPELLESCLYHLKDLAIKQKQYFDVNIFGYSSEALLSLCSHAIRINCYATAVPEAVIIDSYLLSDLFLSTSSDEGFGIPLLESIMFDLASIVTPIPSYVEIAKRYRPETNSIRFCSSFDLSVSYQLACMVMETSKSFSARTPNEKAKSYLRFYESEYNTASTKLSEFLRRQY